LQRAGFAAGTRVQVEISATVNSSSSHADPSSHGARRRRPHAARQLAAREDRFALLLEGDPGIGKSSSPTSSRGNHRQPVRREQINGQSVRGQVREWRQARLRQPVQRLDVKRIDELDRRRHPGWPSCSRISITCRPEAVIATTNEYSKLRALL